MAARHGELQSNNERCRRAEVEEEKPEWRSRRGMRGQQCCDYSMLAG